MFGRAAVSAAHHGHAAAAAGESVARLRPGAAAGRAAAGRDENLLASTGCRPSAWSCVAALECAWHFNRFDPANPNVSPNLALAWYLIFFALFALFPFLFLKKFADRVVPWAAAALAGPPQFFLIHRLVKAAYPNHVMGLLPAAFAIPPLLSLVVVLKTIPAANQARMTQLAWFGGVALFFITLIFPIQFDRQWITIGWALEGAALLWLFHRVPHPGLRLVGVGLLVAAFVRLAFNPAVLEYHARSATPIFNWYLYAYGIVTVCLFAGARLLAPPRNQILNINAPPILAGLGTVLAFLLLNIEIADYFSAPGSTLTFQFSGDFARDMTYSIAWALFALVLLVIGILRKIPRGALRRHGLVERDAAQTVLPRPRAAGPALPHRRVRRRGGHRHAGVVRLSTFLRRGREGQGNQE